MRLIGYWIRNLKDEEFCAPQEIVGRLDPDVRSRLADYLDAGSVDILHSQAGHSWCRFFCGVPFEKMGSGELTDGCWIWPEGLSHYVREHGIVLPDEFISHALASRPRHPAPDDRVRKNLGDQVPLAALIRQVLVTNPVSLDYWRNWCGARRSPALLERLRQAREKADRHAAVVASETIQGMMAEEIARHGLGDERCIFAGCEERVLAGKKLCAQHVLRGTDCIAEWCYAITREHLA